LAFLFSFGICCVDYLMQTRLPRGGVHSAFEDSWWYRAWNWTVPPEGQRGVGFGIYTAACIIAATIIFYILLTRWERRVASKRRV
jgi:hypothetical protein